MHALVLKFIENGTILDDSTHYHEEMKEQNHPLHIVDRDHIDRLLAKDIPDEGDLVELARLFLRYEDFPGAFDLKEDMKKILNAWGQTRESLNEKTRNIWESGYRPGVNRDNTVGSGFDTSDSDAS